MLNISMLLIFSIRVNVTILIDCGIQWVNTILKITEKYANWGFIMHFTHILETLVKYIVAINNIIPFWHNIKYQVYCSLTNMIGSLTTKMCVIKCKLLTNYLTVYNRVVGRSICLQAIWYGCRLKQMKNCSLDTYSLFTDTLNWQKYLTVRSQIVVNCRFHER
jgi:hypothetical protein